MKAIIFGAPGSGKGTYASRLQPLLNLEVISMGDIFREILKEGTPQGNLVKRYVEKGLLVPDDVVIDVLKWRLSKMPANRGFILDGFPRTLDQAKALNDITKIDVIIHLIVPDWIIVERLSARRICRDCGTIYNLRTLKPKVNDVCDKCGGPLYQRSDDNPEVIKNRLEVYQRQTSPLVKFFKEKNVPFVTFECISLDTPPEAVVETLLKELTKISSA
jgi:adenylate kinase